MRRRKLLAFGALLAVVLLAGCSAAGSLTMQPITAQELAERASRSVDTGAVESEDRPESRLVRDAIRTGSVTTAGPSPPIREGLPFSYRGAYYNISWRVTDSHTVTAVELRTDYNATDPAGQRIAYDELPPPDRAALDALFPPRGDRRVDGYDLGAGVIYNDTERDRSVLVPAQQYAVVVFNGEPYPIQVGDTRAVEMKTYRYTATLVANNTEQYVQQLKREYLFTLSGLSSGERNLVETAIEDGYYTESTDDAAYRSILRQFRRHTAIRESQYSGEWLVRYNGSTYWAELRYSEFVEAG